MNINDLIENLEQLREEHGDDIELRYASQPQWAFENSISDNELQVVEIDGEKRIYLAEGHQIGYLPSEAREAINW